MVIAATLDGLKGLVPHDYASVFEPHYTTHSTTAFAWIIAKAEKGSIYVKIANPSSEEVILHCSTQIGTFHATSGSNKDEYAVMDSSDAISTFRGL